MSHRRLAARANADILRTRPKLAATRLGHCEQRRIQERLVAGRAGSAVVAKLHGLGSDGQPVWPKARRSDRFNPHRPHPDLGTHRGGRQTGFRRDAPRPASHLRDMGPAEQDGCLGYCRPHRHVDEDDRGSLWHHDPEFQASAAGAFRRQA